MIGKHSLQVVVVCLFFFLFWSTKESHSLPASSSLSVYALFLCLNPTLYFSMLCICSFPYRILYELVCLGLQVDLIPKSGQISSLSSFFLRSKKFLLLFCFIFYFPWTIGAHNVKACGAQFTCMQFLIFGEFGIRLRVRLINKNRNNRSKC